MVLSSPGRPRVLGAGTPERQATGPPVTRGVLYSGTRSEPHAPPAGGAPLSTRSTSGCRGLEGGPPPPGRQPGSELRSGWLRAEWTLHPQLLLAPDSAPAPVTSPAQRSAASPLSPASHRLTQPRFPVATPSRLVTPRARPWGRRVGALGPPWCRACSGGSRSVAGAAPRFRLSLCSSRATSGHGHRCRATGPLTHAGSWPGPCPALPGPVQPPRPRGVTAKRLLCARRARESHAPRKAASQREADS